MASSMVPRSPQQFLWFAVAVALAVALIFRIPTVRNFVTGS